MLPPVFTIYKFHSSQIFKTETADVLQKFFYVIPVIQNLQFIGVAGHDKQRIFQIVFRKPADFLPDIRVVVQGVDGNMLGIFW